MFYLFHGEDEYSRREAIRAAVPASGSDEALALSVFDGAADVNAVIEASNALPFLSTKRYVLLRNFITANTKRGKKAGDDEDDSPAADAAPADDLPASKRPMQVLRDYLPHLPETTDLVLDESGKVPANSVLLKYAREHGQERELKPLFGPDLVRWIGDQFAARKAAVHPAAVQLLARFVGPDLLLLEKEIDKLAAYAGSETLQPDDVAEMVPSAEETKVWDMIDAAALGRPKEALGQLRRLLADSANPPLRTLGAITNRFRTMVIIKELADRRLSDFAIAREAGVPDWSVRNTRPLLRSLSMDQLKRIYERLLETDMVLKSSPLDDKLTLELLVLDIATRNLDRSPGDHPREDVA